MTDQQPGGTYAYGWARGMNAKRTTPTPHSTLPVKYGMGVKSGDCRTCGRPVTLGAGIWRHDEASTPCQWAGCAEASTGERTDGHTVKLLCARHLALTSRDPARALAKLTEGAQS